MPRQLSEFRLQQHSLRLKNFPHTKESTRTHTHTHTRMSLSLGWHLTPLPPCTYPCLSPCAFPDFPDFPARLGLPDLPDPRCISKRKTNILSRTIKWKSVCVLPRVLLGPLPQDTNKISHLTIAFALRNTEYLGN